MNHIFRILTPLWLLCLLSCLTACNHKVFFSDTQSVDEQGWQYDQPLTFDVSINDTTQFYDIFIDLRNSVRYPYSNTFLFITTTFPDTSVAKDTLECPLADPSGQWYGKNSGRYVDNRSYFRRKTRFPIPGTYHFQISHGMREKSIDGIKNIGLRFEK